MGKSKYVTEPELDLDPDWKVDNKPKMVSKRAYSKCYQCFTKFSRIKSKNTSYRHHCRICGNMFCKNCIGKLKLSSKYWKGKKKENLSTVCLGCYANAMVNRVERGAGDKHTKKFFKRPALVAFVSAKADTDTGKALQTRVRAVSQPQNPTKVEKVEEAKANVPAAPKPSFKFSAAKDDDNKNSTKKKPRSPSKSKSMKWGEEDLTGTRYARPFGYGVDLSILQQKKKEREQGLGGGARRRRVTLSGASTNSADSPEKPKTPRGNPMKALDPEDEMRKALPSLLGKIELVESLKLTGEQLEEFAKCFRYCRVTKGDHVFKEGDIGGEDMYLVYSGAFTASHTKRDNNAREETLGTRPLKQGDYFGELSMTCEILPRSYSVRAKEQSEICMISNEAFRAFLLKETNNQPFYQETKRNHVEALLRDLGVYLFSLVPKDKHVELADLCELQELMEGEVLYKKDDLIGGIDYILSGSIDINGTRVESGRYFGEKALIVPQISPCDMVAKERTLILQLDGQAFCQLFAEALESYATFALQVAQDTVPLLPVITHSMGHDYFDSYLAESWMDRHLRFFEEIGRFRQLSELDMQVAAGKVADRFLDPDASEQINVGAYVRKRTLKKLQGVASRDVFSMCLAAVMELMSEDYLKSFKNTQDFKNLLQVAGKHEYPANSVMVDDGMMVHGGKSFQASLRSDLERITKRQS